MISAFILYFCIDVALVKSFKFDVLCLVTFWKEYFVTFTGFLMFLIIDLFHLIAYQYNLILVTVDEKIDRIVLVLLPSIIVGKSVCDIVQWSVKLFIDVICDNAWLSLVNDWVESLTLLECNYGGFEGRRFDETHTKLKP